MHWRVKTGRMTWQDLFSADNEDNSMTVDDDANNVNDDIPVEPSTAKSSNQSSMKTNGGSSSSSSNNNNGSNHGNSNGLIVSCPICYEQVSGLRFANHLEKCMRGGKRGARGSRPFAELSLPYISTTKVKVDPHPQSLVIRVKLKNGQLKPGQIREGASLEEFTRLKQLEQG